MMSAAGQPGHGCRRSRRRPMTVKSILSSKGRDVATIEPTATLEAAIALLAQRRIGALVVLGPERRLIGILSERDIVRVLATQGAGALSAPLAQVMTRKVSTCSESDTVSAIMEQMTAGKFRHVPVLDQDRLVGIVSIGDVVKYRLGEMEREQEALRDYIQTA
jgi:CBS domain-containing protein